MSRTPSIVMPIASFSPKIGGAERQAQLLGRELVKRGWKITVLTRRYPGLPSASTVDGISVRRLPVLGKGRNRMSSVLFVIGVFSWLVRHRSAYDVVHAHQAFSPATAAVLAKAVTGRPVLVKIAGSGPDGDIDRIRRRPLAGLRPWVLRHVDRFLTLNSETRDELVDLGISGTAVESIVNGVDTDHFAPSAVRSEEGCTVLFVGRLSEVKGLDVLLDAWGMLVAGTEPPFEDVRLVIVGDGPERLRLEGLAREYGIEESVEFVGFKQDVQPFLTAASILVLPSRAEGLPNAMLEAMSCGVPVVASAVGGIPTVIRENKEGKLVPPGDARCLFEALSTLIKNPDLSRELGQRARQRAMADYSLSRLLAQHENLYRQVM